MKRKFKLFATVASLCLCLALMAFGVYAAANVEFNVGGSVKFDVTGQFVQIDYTLESKVGGVEQTKDERHAYSYQKGADDVLTSGDSKVYSGESSGIEISANKDSFSLIAFTKVGDFAKYTITLTNKGALPIKADIVLSGVTETIEGLTIDDDSTGANNANLAANGTITYTLKLELADLQHNVNVPNINFKVSSSYAS